MRAQRAQLPMTPLLQSPHTQCLAKGQGCCLVPPQALCHLEAAPTASCAPTPPVTLWWCTTMMFIAATGEHSVCVLRSLALANKSCSLTQPSPPFVLLLPIAASLALTANSAFATCASAAAGRLPQASTFAPHTALTPATAHTRVALRQRWQPSRPRTWRQWLLSRQITPRGQGPAGPRCPSPLQPLMKALRTATAAWMACTSPL
jgi:hypothetical protein